MRVFNIKGMKCQSCVSKINSALKEAGYNDAVVSFDPAQIKLSVELTEDQLNKIISRAGDYSVIASVGQSSTVASQNQEEEKLTPLFVILSYIAGGVLLIEVSSGNSSFASLMNNFMGVFLVIFSMFKLLNLKGFADAYATYDLVASRYRVYGLIYPFIELLLGVAYLIEYQPLIVNTATLTLMTIGSVGVYKALLTKRKFQCACLGTALKLPMTKVTLVEDVGMGLMALIMIIHALGI